MKNETLGADHAELVKRLYEDAQENPEDYRYKAAQAIEALGNNVVHGAESATRATMNTDEFFEEAKRLKLRMLGSPAEVRAALDLKDAEIERLRSALEAKEKQEPVAYVAPAAIEWLGDPKRGADARIMTALCKAKGETASAAIYTEPVAATEVGDGEVLFWYRPCSDESYEGPIHHSRIEEVRKRSGAWVPLAPVRVRAVESAEPGERTEEVTAAPSLGLLMSMAIRYDHGLGLAGHYDSPLHAGSGMTHAQRLDSTLRIMRQLWEEAAGCGFYRPEKEEYYQGLATNKAESNG